MKSNKKNFYRPLLKSLADDIVGLMETNEGRLLALEMLEEIPADIKNDVLEGLSSFYNPQMVYFFSLLKWEYGKEYEAICDRALTKYRLAGLDVDYKQPVMGRFYKAFASLSRHTGRMTLDMAWETGKDKLYVECFFLTFSSDGIHSFFIVNEISISQYEKDRGLFSDMIELSYKEGCFLLCEAYKLNVRYMTRPALGKFLYQKYLDDDTDFPPAHTNNVLRKVCARLSPRQLGNSFFHALRYQDYNYILSILYNEQPYHSLLLHQLNNSILPGTIIMEGQVEEVRASVDFAEITAFSTTLQEREVYHNEYIMRLVRDTTGSWCIRHLENTTSIRLDADSSLNPFNMQVYCRVYEIIDIDDLFDVLDQLDDIREVEELPYGLHMRLTCFEDDFNHGISFMTGVIADLVINADEFVVISQDIETLDELHCLFMENNTFALVQRGEYEINLISAYNYLSGQYANFEDILLNEDTEVSDFVFEDGMRFITARYLIKDRAKVMARLAEIKSLQIDLQGELQVYYELEDEPNQPGLFAEYILGSSWVTVSAFGEKDINLIRRNFERDMYDALEFDGLELREDGIFAILSLDVKRQYPQLESALKDLYLNKWYHSNLPTLRGMSPLEACQTEEGKRLLWTLFKRIKQKEKKRHINGDRRRIGLKEYLRKVEFEKENQP
ncbi:Uncharacterized [Syntrophomonas zehnderi OL-4]|uniref:Uncharacterized n=1 Tax=Syntrophomonas zehnderi OL-4 TaxID=690567 RepID=A0A0E4GEE7_9FIRM|nr:hypothetical protein [Syntrophomonas zehnderi]CFX86118.1 Uncharacterized [Syntrophomonas zehnderi OL-4]